MALSLNEPSQFEVEAPGVGVERLGRDKSLETLITMQRGFDIAPVRQIGAVAEDGRGGVPRHITWLSQRNTQKSATLGVITTYLSRVESIAPFLVRLGLAFVFSYAAIAILFQPELYTHYMPLFIREIYDPTIELNAFAVFELLLSIWLLLGVGARFASIVAFIAIFAVTVVNLESFSVVFRDVSIVSSALALVFMEWKGYMVRKRPANYGTRASETEKVIVESARDGESEPLSRQVPSIVDGDVMQVKDTSQVVVGDVRHKETAPLSGQALAIAEEQLEDSRLETAVRLNREALLYHSQGKYVEAEQLYRRVLTIKVQHLGPHHPDTATSFYDLALLYHSQGKYEATEVLYTRVLAIREQHLGDDHPDTAHCLYSLARLYRERGRDKEAELLCRRASIIRKQPLQPVRV